jgi:hypothetical protein
MDKEYVQEHILLTVLSRQLEAPRRLIHGRLQPFRSAFSVIPDTSLLVWLLLCWF